MYRMQKEEEKWLLTTGCCLQSCLTWYYSCEQQSTIQYILIYAMILSPLLHNHSLLYSSKFTMALLLKQASRAKLIQNFTPQEPQLKGALFYYNQIRKKKYQYLSFYTKVVLPYFPFLGVNSKTNYHQYIKYIEYYSKDTGSKQNQKNQTQSLSSDAYKKVRNLTLCLLALLLYKNYILQDNSMNKIKQDVNKLVEYTQGIQITSEQQAILAKLVNLKDVYITETKKDSTQYMIRFNYTDGTYQLLPYIGNINNILRLLQHLQQGKFQKAKVYIQGKTYSFIDSFADAISLVFPFFGIAVTYYLFRKFSPDTLLSKIGSKKSFKIEGLRDIKTKFADVAGMEQAKKQITQFVDFLKQGQKYVQMGAKIPKGALLTGPPGTGKTMLARACAGQAGVAFFYISGSEFVEMFVGLGASKVRQLFARARMQAPSIIFIDQIDAIGKKRQTSRNEQKDSTLNQLLVEMDGFSSHQTVIVLAATNRKDILDSALTRPGRFDRMVEVTLPDIAARESIFKVHLKPLKINPDKKMDELAKRLGQLTPGFSGADIANLCNEAAIIATRRKKMYIQDKDFEDASERITAGYQKKNLLNPKTKKRVAYHEAGHAVCGWYLKGGDPLIKLTIIPRSKGALGYAQYLPKSSYIRSRGDLIDQIAIMMGGITSEELQFGDISSGGSDDLQRVYQVARQMVASYGMGKNTYNVTLDEQQYVRKESQYLSRQMDEQMMTIVEQAKNRCRSILVQKKAIIHSLAEMLLEKETINSEDIIKIMGQRPSFA